MSRTFTSALLAMPLMTIFLVACGDRQPEKTVFYVGSYAASQDTGIYLYEYNAAAGTFLRLQGLSGHENPSFLAICPSRDFLFAVNETAGHVETGGGMVSSFSICDETGMLTHLNSEPAMGAHPCHISVFPDGEKVAVANYTGGSVAVLPVLSDGRLASPLWHSPHEGSGPDPRRQRSPHAHSVYPVAGGSVILAADLGADKIMIYRIDPEGSLVSSSYVMMEPGAGPRHIAFHPSGGLAYVINELNSTITRLTFDEDPGTLRVHESVSTLPADQEGENWCADIRVHPGGRYLYASNRGHNSIAVFEITGEGKLVNRAFTPSGGEWPRNFNIEPSGRLMFVANQHSGNIAVFEISQESGLLSFTGNELAVDRPVCIEFLNR